MYIPDLTTYPLVGSDWKRVNIGWLDYGHPYTKGFVSRNFKDRLDIFESEPYIASMGSFPCPFCQRRIGLFRRFFKDNSDISNDFELEIPNISIFKNLSGSET
jgi:hypothetical protein